MSVREHTKLQPSPYIVVRPLWTTTLVKRLADGFTTLYSNNDLKKYNGGSPLFSDLPVEISRVFPFFGCVTGFLIKQYGSRSRSGSTSLVKGYCK